MKKNRTKYLKTSSTLSNHKKTYREKLRDSEYLRPSEKPFYDDQIERIEKEQEQRIKDVKNLADQNLNNLNINVVFN